MVTGFMAGVALGQKIVGMNKSRPMTAAQRMQAAKLAAYRRMKARQKSQATLVSNAQTVNNVEMAAIIEPNQFNNEFKGDASGYLLNSIRQSINEFNAWIKQQTHGFLDLNISLAFFFIIRGIRKFLIEKQYPSAWQLIWWATSILRGWRFM